MFTILIVKSVLTSVQRLFSLSIIYFKSFVPRLLKIIATRKNHKQPPRGVLRKRCSESIQQIYRRAPMLKCNFNKVARNVIEILLRYGCSFVNLLIIFRTPFPKNTSGGLLLKNYKSKIISNHLAMSQKMLLGSQSEVGNF